MATKDQFPQVFGALRTLLLPFAKHLIVKADTNDHYCLNTPYAAKFKREIMFGAVRVMKNYVSFHLMPVYGRPELLRDISPELRKRMQGKACFNFKSADPALIKELGVLTKRGFEGFKQMGFVK